MAHFTMQQFHYAAFPVVVAAVAVVILDYISCNVVAERAGVASNLLFQLILLNKILELNKLTHTHTLKLTSTLMRKCGWLVACSMLWHGWQVHKLMLKLFSIACDL